MAEEQTDKIAGYRELDGDTTALINRVKAAEAEVASLVALLERGADTPSAGRWCSLARTHLETGFMYLVKSAARPSGGLGDKG